MTSLATKVKQMILGRPEPSKFEEASRIADETINHLRQARKSHDPIRALLADIYFQNHDTALIADAYEMSQESRIYKGNGE